MQTIMIRFCVPAMAIWLCAMPAAAQPAVQETVVVTATAAPESVGNVGRALVVLTREDLLGLPILSVADLLRQVSSVGVRSRGPQGVQADFTIRGAGFGQALVLVNGTRLNDAQSGHHNGDIPLAVEDIERVEVLLGAGSSLHGADAFGGTINVITRRSAPRFLASVAVGQHALVDASATVGTARPQGQAHVFSGELSRSSGFMPARDHDVKLARYQGTLARDTTVTLAYLDKEFGANGFYGPAPSREWTDQTLATFEQRLNQGSRWKGSIDASYRTHGDHFIYDERVPSLSENEHRTHAITANARWHQRISERTQLSVGAGGGRDAIRSSNLGDHAFSRGSAFAEMRQSVAGRLLVHPGVRVDTYSGFGTAWTPSLAISGWSSPRVKWRASAGHAFRVPTFTELYYVDPNHQASGALSPETAWSADAGADAIGNAWTASVTAFARWEENVIDWVRASSAVKWRTTNIRDARTQGIEMQYRRRFGGRGQMGLQYTWLTTDAPALDVLSKYVLDYMRHSAAASASAGWHGATLGSRLELKRRVDGRQYWTLDARVGKPLGRLELFADATNLFDAKYQEIRGVDMPGRWVSVGLKVH
jgi:iron complex outermembrane receptor protein